MATLARNLRPYLKYIRNQRRTYADAAVSDQMKFTFAGANQVFYDETVIKQVDVPSFSGSFGILPKHVPTLAVLKPGVVTVYEEDGAVKKVFVSSGTVTINENNTVQVLAEEAHPLEDFDSSTARELLSKAQQQLASASSEQDKAEATIAVEVTEALVQALQ
ncbi:ATP synthase subunit delta, mitochondrial [Eufriesea mexicana]|uniref:ATP synthase F(1) complex subunit delta, mitochondrial n=1 Tax=Eufriesea mexicana TaxID=516756 RepID=A0A310SBU4_9HYME|nr:PREDICTED: ATP synthase subunit delta, mitochondrial [Eufriesea mexicana]OAD47026.1 ATP synthase subunit delta, mitochondrial [Eufriesea mexicana]